MTSRSRNSQRSEAAFVLPAAIVLIVVLALASIMIMQAGRSSGDARVDRFDALRLEQIAATGLDRFRAGLNSGKIGVVNNYQPTITQWNDFVQPSAGESVLLTSSNVAFAARRLQLTGGVRLAGTRAVTMRIPIGTDLYGYFSPISILPPTTNRSTITMYANVWIATRNSNRVLASRLDRVSLRPTFFSDYQILTDGPIHLDRANITAPVFTNGFDDAFLVETELSGTERIRVESTVTCGNNVSFTTARGTINAMGSCSGATRRAATGAQVNILRARDSLASITSQCGISPTVHCWPGGISRTVTLSGSNVSVSGGGTWSVATTPRVFWFGSNTFVRGSLSSGRATIAVRGAGGTGITLIGPGTVGATSAAAQTGAAVVGLLSDGNVETDLATCPNQINAAIASAGGGLSIPRVYRTAFAVGSNGLATCPDMTVFGSVAGHSPPLLRLQLGTGWVGYQNLSYQYNPTLTRVQPPAWPLTENGWAVTAVGPGNIDCLASIATIQGSECA